MDIVCITSIRFYHFHDNWTSLALPELGGSNKSHKSLTLKSHKGRKWTKMDETRRQNGRNNGTRCLTENSNGGLRPTWPHPQPKYRPNTQSFSGHESLTASQWKIPKICQVSMQNVRRRSKTSRTSKTNRLKRSESNNRVWRIAMGQTCSIRQDSAVCRMQLLKTLGL